MARLLNLERHPHFGEALAIIQTLKRNSFEALFAGGCVRDALLGAVAKDLDIATSARPDDVERLFDKTLAVGREFGTVIVVGRNGNYEVTTFRKDGPYLDGRHPASVEFTDAEEDARRRDFTINALFYDPQKNAVIDFVSGQTDLDARIIRAVGDPASRFQEDHLRLLRAVRFSAQLGFDIEIETWRSVCELSDKIADVSVERILQELLKLVSGQAATLGLERLVRSRLADHIWPSLARLHAQPDVWKSFIARVKDVRQPAAVFAFFGIVSGLDVKWLGELEKLKPSGQLIQSVQRLMEAHDLLWNQTASKSERIRLWARPEWSGILAMAEAEAAHRKGGTGRLEGWIAEFLEVCDGKGNLPKPLLSGEDLLKMGFSPGPLLGRTLSEIYRLQLEGQIKLQHQAEALARSQLSGGRPT